ncbi:MAG: sulfatase-like hydrolase/transferase [Methylococcaceae bacterium]
MSEDTPKTDRRSFIKAAAVGVAGLGPLRALASPGSSVSNEVGSSSNGQSIRGKPNILIIMVDEQRYPTMYESAELKEFRKSYLPAQERLRKTGIEFHRHYAASVACAPSRASFYTGHYPSLHGVSNTDGTAKSAADSDMHWLNPNTVPTIGNYFRTAGYRTFYKGKWHVSHADLLVPGTHNSLPSYDEQGNRDPAAEARYLAAGLLEAFGFTGWIGPEPHGADPLKSASSAKNAKGRDEAIAGQFIDLIDQLEASSDDTPWLSVCSLVNPHDIVLYGLFGRIASSPKGEFNFSVEDFVPAHPFDENFLKTVGDKLTGKPRVQQSYQRLYKKIFQPLPTSSDYLRLYYQLHQEVDQQIDKIYTRLQSSRFFDNTIVVFVADHGDLLGAHGLHQKWFTAYEEAIRVPLIFSCPSLIPTSAQVNIPTSHVDILPTLLGLAGLDINTLRDQLEPSFTDARLPIGRNISGIIYGSMGQDSAQEPIYFMTDDDPSRGAAPYNVIGVKYNPVRQPSHIETVIAFLNGSLWKYSRYFDNTQFWSGSENPANPVLKDVYSREVGRKENPGIYTVPLRKTIKVEAVADQYEMYNVTTDPMELSNLAGSDQFSSIEAQLHHLLTTQSKSKRLVPSGNTNNGSYIPGYG